MAKSSSWKTQSVCSELKLLTLYYFDRENILFQMVLTTVFNFGFKVYFPNIKMLSYLNLVPKRSVLYENCKTFYQYSVDSPFEGLF